MTPEEIVVAALGIASTYSDSYPSTRSVMYRRISVRQRELFVHIAALDPELFGADVVVDVVDGAANLAALEQSGDVYPVERVQVVRIEDAGASDLDTGERVSLVPADDAEAHLAPRATYRSGVVRGWDGDLDDVTSLWIAYARRPRTIGADGSGEIELLEPFQDLLVFDLARYLVRGTVDIDGQVKAVAADLIEKQEAALLQSLEQHVQNGAAVRERRHHG